VEELHFPKSYFFWKIVLSSLILSKPLDFFTDLERIILVQLDLKTLLRLVLICEALFVDQIALLEVSEVLLVLGHLLALLVHPKLHLIVVELAVEYHSKEVSSISVGILFIRFSSFKYMYVEALNVARELLPVHKIRS
jgi:hypothetical protein